MAPRIEQYGQVDANGSIAYVAAEGATLSVNSGMFDIAVTLGTEDSNGIVHGDSAVTGASPSNSGGSVDVAFVAIPKNTLINMLVGGTVGQMPATSAIANDGVITLTTGTSTNAEITLQNATLSQQTVLETN